MVGSSEVVSWFFLGFSLVFYSIKTGKVQGKEILRKRLFAQMQKGVLMVF